MKKQKFSFTYLAILLIIMLLVLSKINVRTVEGFDKVFASTDKNIYICDSGIPEINGKYYGYKDNDYPGLFEGWIKGDGSVKIFKTRNGWMVGETKKPFKVYCNNTKQEFRNDNGIPIPPLEDWISNHRGGKIINLCYGDNETCCDYENGDNLGGNLEKHFGDNKTKDGTSYTDLEYSPIPVETTQPVEESSLVGGLSLPDIGIGLGTIVIVGGLMYFL